jgi:threonine/homoserine/homoserine lactone efflux protein
MPFKTFPAIPGGWAMPSPLPAVLSNRGIRSSFKASWLSHFGLMPGPQYIRCRNQSYI